MESLTTTAIIGYIIGGFIGSIICVACDRLWRLYENKVRVDVTIVEYSYPYRPSACDYDLNISVVNMGFSSLPPSHLDLVIIKDDAHHFHFFESHPNTTSPEWMPHQQKAFVNHLTCQGTINPELKRLHDYERPYRAKLILTMNESGKVLWESEEMGESVLAHLRAAVEQGKFPEGLSNKRHLKYVTWREIARSILRGSPS